MPILTNGSLIDFENPITRIGDRENDLGWFRMIPRPWESRDEVFPRSSIRKLGNFGASFGELYEFEVIPVPNFYLSLTNCTFVPASNFYGIPNYISIELSSTYRAKYPLQHNLRTLLYTLLKASFSTRPPSIAKSVSLGFIALNCRVTCGWRMESRSEKYLFYRIKAIVTVIFTKGSRYRFNDFERGLRTFAKAPRRVI